MVITIIQADLPKGISGLKTVRQVLDELEDSFLRVQECRCRAPFSGCEDCCCLCARRRDESPYKEVANASQCAY